MAETRPGLLRIWEAGEPAVPIEPAPPPEHLDLARDLFQAEILRPLPRGHDPGAVMSLQWYLEAEQMRYQRQGHWLPASLEVARHAGERVLGLGGGLGSDWVQFALNGSEVTVVCPSAAQCAIVQRNFDLRRLPGRCEHAGYYALPAATSSIDVACLIGPFAEADGPAPFLDEVYRVLKPGGKVLAVVPALRSIEAWCRWLPGGRVDAPAPAGILAPSCTRFNAAGLRQLFRRFDEAKVSRRHLRRAEVPTLLRLTPLYLLERLAGKLLVYKGFKPLSAVRGDQAAA
jgi:SAM-dependent methyltransferase